MEQDLITTKANLEARLEEEQAQRAETSAVVQVVCTHSLKHTYVCVCVRVCVYACVCVHVRARVCVRTCVGV